MGETLWILLFLVVFGVGVCEWLDKGDANGKTGVADRSTDELP